MRLSISVGSQVERFAEPQIGTLDHSQQTFDIGLLRGMFILPII